MEPSQHSEPEVRWRSDSVALDAFSCSSWLLELWGGFFERVDDSRACCYGREV
jgi:hypothetical protein